jgi:spore maturation protein CgeB
MLFEAATEQTHFDAVFSFDYFPIISNCCNSHNIPYVSFVYDSPLVSLYSYTIINPCNYVFLFDSAVYLDFKKENIDTVYYMPLAVNVKRLDLFNRTLSSLKKDTIKKYTSEVAFVGTMYNEKHNFFDRMTNLPPYVQGFLDGIINAQMKVYGYYFIEELLNDDIIAELQKALPLYPNNDGVETSEWLFAHYVLARKIANIERTTLLNRLSEHFETKLYTPQPTPEIPKIHNMGPVDYMNDMPYVFKCSDININISLRSIRNGIPLRCLDIMGAGSFLLSNYQEDFFRHFIPGEDLVLFESHDDCIKKCEYYLKHAKERSQIAENGYNKIKEFHTYEVRLQEIFDIVFN